MIRGIGHIQMLMIQRKILFNPIFELEFIVSRKSIKAPKIVQNSIEQYMVTLME